MAWWLAYEELYGDMDKEYPIMKKKENKKDVTILGDSADTISLDFSGVGAADTVTFDNNWWADDGFSVTGNPAGYVQDTINFGEASVTGSRIKGGMGEDHISFNFNPGLAHTAYDDPKYYAGVDTLSFKKPQPNLKNGSNQKYQEDKGIEDLKSYVASTYQGHYTNENSDVQTLDLIHSVGDAESFCRSNALKYLSRYDKKGSAKNDILKAMHYCLLLYYFSGNTQEPDYTNTRYETF